MKKTNLLFLFFLLFPFLSSCSDTPETVTSKSVPYTNLSEDYSISDKNFKIYFLNNDESTPYVDVDSFIADLSGFFNTQSIVKIRSDVFSIYSLISNGCKVQFDWKKDQIKVTNMDFFYYVVNSSSVTNYSSYIKAVDYESSKADTVTFKLSNYGYRVHKNRESVLIPLVIANTLFCSPNYFNLFYRGDKIFSYYGEIDYRDPLYQEIFNGVTISNNTNLRQATVNSLCFIMDYFYGLKNEKFGSQSFKNYIPEATLDGLMSIDPVLNKSALTSLLVTGLDDLHTRIDSVSLANTITTDAPYTRADLGTFGTNYYATRDLLNSKRNEAFSGELNAVRYCGDTAIITFDSFVTGTNEQIFDNDGFVKSDAWKYDSYWFMKSCLDQIDSHGNINDILLDISLNGGGNIGALIRVYGFISDQYYLDYSYDTLTHEQTLTKYLIDTDRDNDYNDIDSYSNYRWTLLSGINTFSAANSLITKVKQTGVAKVIGQKSGGGMCSVFPTVLGDGTAIAISSRNTIRYYENNMLKSTEFGHLPNLEIPYDDFYNDSLLVNYIDNLYQD